MTESATLRRGTPADTPAIFEVFLASVRDLAKRLGTPWEATDADNRERLAPLVEHIGAHAAEWWIAELPDGEIVGYAASGSTRFSRS